MCPDLPMECFRIKVACVRTFWSPWTTERLNHSAGAGVAWGLENSLGSRPNGRAGDIFGARANAGSRGASSPDPAPCQRWVVNPKVGHGFRGDLRVARG